MVLILLFVGMLALAFNIHPVKASETIYIRADGSVDPDTAPISSVDHVTYTFTDNIHDSIVVKKNNIVVDGAGYTLQGTRSGKGITLSETNVTIKNMKIKAFYYGVYLYESSNNTISGNNITNNGWNGIGLYWSSNYNIISGNNITNNGCGIGLDDSSNNNISANNIRNNEYGITLCWSLNNTISGNNLTNNDYGIYLFDSSNNFIYYNNFVDNTKQVFCEFLNKDIWDDGYPSGGNFWSDYTGVDICSGPYQNETGSDGIGDTPYVIDADNQDNYPLMSPWGDVESPVADAGPDLTVGFGTTVTFDGSKSIDDVAIKSFVWTFTDITPQTLTGMRPEYTFDNVGDFEVTLNVSDHAGNWNTDTVTVTVLPDFTLTIYGSPTGVAFTVDGVSRTTPWSGIYSENTSVSFIMPEIHTVGDTRYYWNQWSDGNTSRSRTVTMNTRITLTAHYEPGPVYIRADGSVDPDTAPISSVDNVTFTFTDNVYDEIVVERNNIVVDGAGYFLQGTGSGTGIDLWGISNVTIKNTKIKWFRNGIWLYFSYNNTISANIITNNENGILVDFSDNNSISENHITANNESGIRLGYSSNNRVSGNNITNNEYGIQLYASSNYNSISDNNMAANERLGIGLARTSDYNIVSGNNITENGSGVEIYDYSSNNNITGNHITANNGFGIMLQSASNYNAITGNNITNNEQGIRLNRSSKNVISGNNITARNYYGIYLNYYSSSNTISRNNITNNIYGVRLYYSSNNTIDENNITGNNEHGIWFSDFSNYNAITGNNITNNYRGILLDGSSNHNSVSRNNITDNRYGIAFGESSYNRIYHNNFIGNTQQVFREGLNKNVWDDGYPSGGNYWSYHICSGNPSDGSQPYIIDFYNIDHYPFQDPNGWLFPQLTVTSSPITGIAFTIDGVPHTTPYTNRLPEGSYTIEMPQTHNGYVWCHWLEDGDTNRIKTITLPGTTYTAVYTEPPIGGTTVTIQSKPSSSWITPTLLILTIAVASRIHRKHKRPTHKQKHFPTYFH